MLRAKSHLSVAFVVAIAVGLTLCACSDSNDGVTTPTSGALPGLDNPTYVWGYTYDYGTFERIGDVHIEIWYAPPKANPPCYVMLWEGSSEPEGSGAPEGTGHYKTTDLGVGGLVDVFAFKEGYEEYHHYGLYINSEYTRWDIYMVPE